LECLHRLQRRQDPGLDGLEPLAGYTIDLYFTTWQDGAFTLQMMYVDDIEITGIGSLDDVEAGEDGWPITDGILDSGYGVARYPEPAGNNAMSLHSTSSLIVDPDTQTSEDRFSAIPTDSGWIKVSIVANR
jgi:hypothetical protein